MSSNTSPSIPSTQSRIILINRPKGDIDPNITSGKGTFKLETDVAVEEPKDGEVLIRVEWSSIDPAMRGWLDDSRSYIPPVGLNEVMRAGVVGSIVKLGPSDTGDFKVGDHVNAYVGWQEYGVASVKTLQKLPASLSATPEKALSVLGMVAQTAYWGLFDVAKLTSKDKLVVISGAAGAVGSIAIQLAKVTGCEKVVGIAGGKDKCQYVKDTLGADECLDYKSPNFEKELKALGFVDVYFDNVGGEILDLVLAQLAVHARIAFCGAISTYNSTGDHYRLQNYVQVLLQKAKLEGFIVMDYIPRFGGKLSEYYSSGRLILAEHKVEGGIEKSVDALRGVFTGFNTGKTLVHFVKE